MPVANSAGLLRLARDGLAGLAGSGGVLLAGPAGPAGQGLSSLSATFFATLFADGPALPDYCFPDARQAAAPRGGQTDSPAPSPARGCAPSRPAKVKP